MTQNRSAPPLLPHVELAYNLSPRPTRRSPVEGKQALPMQLSSSLVFA